MEIRSVTSQCVVPPFLEKKFACWHSHMAKLTIPFLRSGYEEEISYFMATTWVGAITPMIFVSQDENPPSWISSCCLKGLESNFGTASITPKMTSILLNVTWTWFTKGSSSKTSFVGFKCPLHTLSKSANLWGHSLSAATYWRLHPPGAGPDKSSSTVLFLSRFCLGILSHIQKSNMAMFGSKLASRLFKVKHLPNSGFPGIQWVDLLLSTRNWAMSRGAVVPCNCAEKQLVTPDLHAETNWLCWWVRLRIVSFFFSLR